MKYKMKVLSLTLYLQSIKLPAGFPRENYQSSGTQIIPNWTANDPEPQMILKSHIINPLLTKLVWLRRLTLALFFFCEFTDRGGLEVHKHAKKNFSSKLRLGWAVIVLKNVRGWSIF